MTRKMILLLVLGIGACDESKEACEIEECAEGEPLLECLSRRPECSEPFAYFLCSTACEEAEIVCLQSVEESEWDICYQSKPACQNICEGYAP